MSTDRNQRGQFVPGNRTASHGGRARAAQLSAEDRRRIASAGWHALVERRFGGDTQAAIAYISKLGAWAAERSAYAGTPLYQPAWEHPGPMPTGGEA